ncbi:hypothetical protein BS78_04G264800 [Paspalum vaginatum]|nr:hypothetical protein BS78_04G264800 [Paspalum vaginatum]
MASLVFEYHHRHLKVQTFSSELGAWGPCTEIRTPQIQGAAYEPLRPDPLVVAGAMHWLCLTDSAGYVLKLRVRAAAPPRLTVTNLPESFPYNDVRYRWYVQHLMVTMAAGGSQAVLVTDMEKISVWTQSKHTGRWSQQPQVVIDYAAISTCLRNLRMPGGNMPLPLMTS